MIIFSTPLIATMTLKELQPQLLEIETAIREQEEDKLYA